MVCRRAAAVSPWGMARTESPAALGEAARAAHDLGLAALLGGTLFGRLALHPSVAAISDPRERGEVVNASWRRYGVVNSVGLAAILAGWAGSRATDARDRRPRLSPRRVTSSSPAAPPPTTTIRGSAAAPGRPSARGAAISGRVSRRVIS